MPIFILKNSNKVLFTNYKVMYSTLRYSENMNRISLTNELKKNILLNRFYLNQTQFYFIARDPYSKLESFFKEKFRKSSDFYQTKGYWQDSQKIFFPFLNIDESMDPDLIKEKLKMVNFKDMIDLLPDLYMLDEHLQPQYLKSRISFRKFGIKFIVPIRLKKIFKLESQSDLQELKDKFDIDINSRVNSTATVNENIEWTKEMRNIVNQIYKKDFSLFNYELK